MPTDVIVSMPTDVIVCMPTDVNTRDIQLLPRCASLSLCLQTSQPTENPEGQIIMLNQQLTALQKRMMQLRQQQSQPPSPPPPNMVTLITTAFSVICSLLAVPHLSAFYSTLSPPTYYHTHQSHWASRAEVVTAPCGVAEGQRSAGGFSSQT